MSITGLAPSAHRATMRGRQVWNTLATDRCHVTREAQPGDDEYVADEDRVMDPVTFQYPPQGRVTVYKGPCRLQVKADINSNVVEATAGDRESTYLTSQFQVCVEADQFGAFADHDSFDGTGFLGDPALIDVDHTAEMLLAPYDSALEGRLFKIAGPYHKSQSNYRRFRVNEAV